VTELGIVFGLDYPSDNSPLYSNVNAASGWCFHPTEPLQAVRLELNERFQSEGIIGYPRLDVAQRYPRHRAAAMSSGFHCYFDASALVSGDNQFTFHIRTAASHATLSKTVTLKTESAFQRISDVFIDIVGPCNLRCAMCPQGVLEYRSAERGRGFMPVALFEHTMMFLQEQGFLGEYVNLYNWGDPLLHPRLGEILDVCQVRHIKPIISTNLSFPVRTVREASRHDLALLIVSISGFSASTYSRNHVRGDFHRVRQNLEALADDRGRIREVLVKYLTFRYNRQELEAVREFSLSAGFQFGAYAGAIPSAESFFRYTDDSEYRAKVNEFIAAEWIRPQPSRFCSQETSVTINHMAELERCYVSWNGAYRTSLFETDLRQYLDAKTKNEFCGRCLATGYSYYKHFKVAIPELIGRR
jgi:MoaA/NifB/PqqE/SkfB family radical SAM enzyme